MKEYEKHLKSILDVYKTTTFRTFSSAGLNIPQTQLEYLAARGLITIVPHGGNSFDYRITVEDKALTYFDDKYICRKEVWIERFWGFLTGCLLTSVLPYAIEWIISYLKQNPK